MLLYCLLLHCATYFMFISLQICSSIYLFYFKVKKFKDTTAREELFSVNLARRLEKLPTPALQYHIQNKNNIFLNYQPHKY